MANTLAMSVEQINPPHPSTNLFSVDKPTRQYFTSGLGNGTIPNVQQPYYSNGVDDLIDSRAATRELVNFIVLKYITTAMSSPFEVSKTLLQVQYMPRGDNVVSVNAETKVNNDIRKGLERGKNRGTNEKKEHSRENSNTSVASDPLDSSGSEGLYDSSIQQPYQIKPIEGGVWKGIKALLNQTHEGWSSLFKGQYTNWIYEILHLFLQPTIEGILNDIFDLYDDTIPLVHLDRVGPNLATLVASNLIVGYILSPLELVRTRLQVQSASPLHKKYNGPFHALRTIIQEEGLYASHSLLPTVLYHTIVPLLQNTAPLIIDRALRISVDDSPLLYHSAMLGLNTLEIVITTPIDTLRKRLQCQVNSNRGKKFEAVVALRPVPYTGMLNAASCIMKEEGGGPSKKSDMKLRRKSVFTDWSLRGLYHGYYLQCTSNIVLFFLHVVNSIEDEYEEF